MQADKLIHYVVVLGALFVFGYWGNGVVFQRLRRASNPWARALAVVWAGRLFGFVGALVVSFHLPVVVFFALVGVIIGTVDMMPWGRVFSLRRHT